jgi:hypothetical protein
MRLRMAGLEGRLRRRKWMKGVFVGKNEGIMEEAEYEEANGENGGITQTPR